MKRNQLPEIHYRTNRDEAYGLMEDLADLGFVTEVVNDGNVYAVVVGDHFDPQPKIHPSNLILRDAWIETVA